MKESNPNKDSQISIEFQVHLTEYQKMRDEIIHRIESASQSLLLSLSSSSVILPILFSQINNVAPIVLGLFLYILAIIYAVIGMHFATTQYYVTVISNYIHQDLTPKLNLRLHTPTKSRVLQAEYFIRSARHNVVALYLSAVGAIAIGLIILMPSLLSLLFAQYSLLQSVAPTSQSTSTLQLLTFWVSPLSITAWIFFILSALSQILVVSYAAMTGFIIDGTAKK